MWNEKSKDVSTQKFKLKFLINFTHLKSKVEEPFFTFFYSNLCIALFSLTLLLS